ncbi:MAG: hypothetical protein A2X31_06365 [Elusimicrobia bacterium GWB2_63_22]|nr:MAG: hypothetical protein A2X31_06365 [Elusimicrobia bacterium GWB2_63_22]
MSLDNVKRGTLLVLEDDKGTCELEAQRLEGLGLEIRRAYTPEEGRSALAAGPQPELLLIDYSLPGTNALEFIEKLRASGVEMPPFMVVTGRGDEAVAVAAMKAGACDYLVKNSEFLDNLLPAVKKSLEKVALRRELEAAQQSTARNLHLYSFLAQVNLAASQTRDRGELYRRICDIAVTAGGLRMAWVGLYDRDLSRIVPYCWAGKVDGYLDGLKVPVGSDAPESKGPTGLAAATGAIQACSDIIEAPEMLPWREKALARGYRSSAAIPLEENGRLVAVLSAYSGQPGFFSGDEIKLLGEIAADISLALNGILSEEKREKAQNSLEHTAAQLAHIMDVTPVILFTLKTAPSGETYTDWISGNAPAITGYAVEEILTPGWWLENIHPEDKTGVIEGQKDLLSKKSLTQDFRFRRKDGSWFWVHGQLNVSPERRGEITGSWTDITRLKESEERFQELFEKTPVGYQSLDEQGRLLAVSDTWCRVFGRGREEVLGHSLSEYMTPGYRAGFSECFEHFKSSGTVDGLEFEIERPDGSRRWLNFSGKVATNKDGTFRQTYCVFTDITEHREQNKRMQLLSDAIGASFDEVYIFDPEDFHFIFVNQSAFRNLGYSADEIRKLTPWDLKKRDFTEESFRKAVAPLLTGQQHQLLFEALHFRKDGSSYPVETRLQLVESAEEKFLLAVANDISERKSTERMMAEMANMQRVESLGALAGGIAHDFNNMLTGIMANLSLLSARTLGKENVDIIHDTMEAARSAQALTTQLLSFSSGGKPVKKELCLEKALRDIFVLATRGAAVAQELDVEERLWSVEGDENQLKQAVNNILLNGIQAMPSGGTIRLRAENVGPAQPVPALLAPGDYVKITISDTGIGIPAEYLPRIFEPYFTTKSRGHGLGLPMAWSVVKNHGGHIEAASEPGKGTEFRIFLPSTGRCLKSAPESVGEVVKGSGRILLLEDEEIVSRAARRMLTELGYACEITADGAETLALYSAEKAAGRPFAAVIMDLTIPGGMGGKEAGQELKRLHPEAVIIVSSGYSEEPVMAEYKSFGFDAVLPKPYRYEDLAGALARLLNKK